MNEALSATSALSNKSYTSTSQRKIILNVASVVDNTVSVFDGVGAAVVTVITGSTTTIKT